MTYNGGAAVAMTGKNCFAIASDKRLGIQMMTVSCDFPKVFKMHDRLYIGLTGLAADVLTLAQTLRFRLNLFKLKEGRDMPPKMFGHLVSNILYEKRFAPYFAEPVIAGLDEEGKPFITATDLIGAAVSTDDFVVAGTCSENLYGMCESLYRKDMSPDELFEVVSQALLAAVDRDALSGWGAVVHIVTPEGVTTRELKGRMD